MKANPFADVLETVVQRVDGFDIATGGELAAAIGAGRRRHHGVSFAGPRQARRANCRPPSGQGATLNLELAARGRSRAVGHCRERSGKTPRLAIRVNPDFDLKGIGHADGRRRQALRRRRRCGVRTGPPSRRRRARTSEGLHIFAGLAIARRRRDHSETQGKHARALPVAADAGERQVALPHLNHRPAGFGVPYFPGDGPLDLSRRSARRWAAQTSRPRRRPRRRSAWRWDAIWSPRRGSIRPGFVDRKDSHGKTFLVTDGGLHHQLAASGNFGTVVRRNYPVAVATRFGAPGDEVVSVVGCLCTPLDRLADDVLLPAADVGDVIAVFLAGAYGATASPAAFLGHAPACEMAV